MNQGTNRNNNLSTNFTEGNLQTFKPTLIRCLQEFENKHRKVNPSFDVYNYLGEHLEYYPTNIRKWFNDFDQTGTKLGVKDLKEICIILKTSSPIKSLLFDVESLLEENPTELKNEFIEHLKSQGLLTSYLVGQLSNELIRSLDIETPNELTKDEKKSLQIILDELIQKSKSLKQIIEEA